MPLALTARTARWTSDDAAEQYVRDLLVHRPGTFENLWFDRTERGEYLPQMTETIPGQYDPKHGIDVFAVDYHGRLWIIEVSRGTVRGAARFKGGGKPVRYAGDKLQMSAEWRAAAAARFLERADDACDKLRDLLHLPAGRDDADVKATFVGLLRKHRKAVIIPLGGHFDTIGTDVDFTRDVYTCVFPARLLAG